MNAIELERRFEKTTKCAKAGIKHKFTREGKPFNIFYDGEVSGIWREQKVKCKLCGYETWRPALESVKNDVWDGL